jgi:hypothetical protein
MRCALRELRDEDLSVLFEQLADPVAAHMAAFTAPDHMDRHAFERVGFVNSVAIDLQGKSSRASGPQARKRTRQS